MKKMEIIKSKRNEEFLNIILKSVNNLKTDLSKINLKYVKKFTYIEEHYGIEGLRDRLFSRDLYFGKNFYIIDLEKILNNIIPLFSRLKENSIILLLNTEHKDILVDNFLSKLTKCYGYVILIKIYKIFETFPKLKQKMKTKIIENVKVNLVYLEMLNDYIYEDVYLECFILCKNKKRIFENSIKRRKIKDIIYYISENFSLNNNFHFGKINFKHTKLTNYNHFKDIILENSIFLLDDEEKVEKFCIFLSFNKYFGILNCFLNSNKNNNIFKTNWKGFIYLPNEQVKIYCYEKDVFHIINIDKKDKIENYISISILVHVLKDYSFLKLRKRTFYKLEHQKNISMIY